MATYRYRVSTKVIAYLDLIFVTAALIFRMLLAAVSMMQNVHKEEYHTILLVCPFVAIIILHFCANVYAVFQLIKATSVVGQLDETQDNPGESKSRSKTWRNITVVSLTVTVLFYMAIGNWIFLFTHLITYAMFLTIVWAFLRELSGVIEELEEREKKMKQAARSRRNTRAVV